MEEIDVSEDPPIEHERTTIKVRVGGPSAVVDTALNSICDLAETTLGIIDFSMSVARGVPHGTIEATSVVTLELIADRAGSIIECLDNIRARLSEIEALAAAMLTPDHTRLFYGYERAVWTPQGRLRAGT